MATQHDIEIYLDECGFPFERIGDGMWMVESPENKVSNIVVSYTAPLLVFRINLMKAPQSNREAFYERLLRLNAKDIPHGAFGLEDDLVVLIDTLQIENMQSNELRASVDSLAFTVAQYYNELKNYLKP